MKRATWQRYKSGRPPSPKMASVDGNPDTIARNDGEGLKDYPGAKAAPGVWQTIVNNIPPHETFVECFAGSGEITRRKRPALATIVIDSDAAVTVLLARRLPFAEVLNTDAVSWLAKNGDGIRQVVYCDPPYLQSVRAVPGRRYYRHEFGEDFEHEKLLTVLRAIKSPVLLSGRRCKLYDSLLKDWRRVDYQTSTHGGPVTESLWCNFPEPTALHDYRFLGRDFRERERIKRKLSRWRARLARMPILERRLLSAAIAGNGDADRTAGNGDATW